MSGSTAVIITPEQSWGINLWDQFPGIVDYLNKSFDFNDTVIHFLKERSIIENDYQKNLTKLCQKYQSKMRKVSSDNEKSTSVQAFVKFIKESGRIADEHGNFGERLFKEIVQVFTQLNKNQRQEKLRLEEQFKRITTEKSRDADKLEKCKESYEKSFMKMEKAYAEHKKAEDDDTLTRAEVKSRQHSYEEKSHRCHKHKQEYAAQLQTTNNIGEKYYHTQIPEIFNTFQNIDVKRIDSLRQMFNLSRTIETKSIENLQRSVNNMEQAVNMINEVQDTSLLNDELKTGFLPNYEETFEELIGDALIDKGGGQQRTNLQRRDRLQRREAPELQHRNLSRAKGGGLFAVSVEREDFSHLPPAQQVRQLEKSIEATSEEIEKVQKEREGTIKLFESYKSNPKLGKSSSVEPELKNLSQKLSQRQKELKKFEEYKSKAIQRMTNGSLRGTGEFGSRPGSIENIGNISSSSQQLFHETSSQSSSSSPKPVRKDYASNVSPAVSSNDITAIKSESPQQQQQPISDDSIDEWADESPSIGTATAKHPFDPSSQGYSESFGAIAMSQGDHVTILESDQGGWTRVRTPANDEGFVPTDYLSSITYRSPCQ